MCFIWSHFLNGDPEVGFKFITWVYSCKLKWLAVLVCDCGANQLSTIPRKLKKTIMSSIRSWILLSCFFYVTKLYSALPDFEVLFLAHAHNSSNVETFIKLESFSNTSKNIKIMRFVLSVLLFPSEILWNHIFGQFSTRLKLSYTVDGSNY